MSKANSIIKLMTFGALGTAAYLQAGSDPESANRLTIMLTSMLGTLSGEVGGGILDRALFDKEAKPHASAVADVVGEAFGKALKETLQRRDDPGSEQMEAIIRRFGEKWRELIAMAEPEIAKTDGAGLLAQLRERRLLEAWELEGLIAEIASDGGDEPYLTDDSIRGISEEVYKRLPAAFLDELADEKSGKPFRTTLIGAISELLNNSDEVLSGIRRLYEKVISIERKIEAAAPPAVKALHQLPPPPADFTGREAEIAELLAALEDASLTISGLHGMGGVGKTALALKLAEKIKERYPDGQFYLDLLGVNPQPLTPAEAMAYVIRAYHPGAKLPESEAELRGIYLSALDNQRALLLMDNARDKKQVEQLIPPASCRLIITSRQSFTLPGIFAKNLDCLPPTDACKLLLAIAPRIGELAGEIARLCGYLPFALRLAASVIAERRNIKPAGYMRQLANAQKRLEMIEASLSLSYDIMSEEQQQRWRMLAVFPDSFDEVAAAAVWETEGGKARDMLGELLAFNLVEWNQTAGRHRLHDLARVFADSRMSEAERDGGRRLHARRYQSVLSIADYLYLQGRNEVLRGLWLFDLERVNIEAGQGWAAEHAGSDEEAAELCMTYPNSGADVLDLRQHPHERIRWFESMLAAARSLKRRDAEGSALGNVGLAYAVMGEPRRAIRFYEQALQIARETGDRRGEGNSLSNTGLAYGAMGEPHRAIEFYEQALQIARETGDRRGEGSALGNMGTAYAALGEPRRAIGFYEQALQIAREAGDRKVEGNALSNMGVAYAVMGEPRRAIEFYEQALQIARETGDRRVEGNALGNLGLSYADLGEPRRAIEFYKQVLQIARETGDRRVEGSALGNMGTAYTASGEPHRAIGFYEQRLVIARETGDRRGEGNALGNLGLSYADLGEPRRAIEFYKQVLQIARETGDRMGEGNTLWNMALALDQLEDRAQAMVHAEAALAIFERIESPHAEIARNRLAEWKASDGADQR